MKPERMPQVERLYHAALECDPGARAAFLAEACAADEELRREVAGLLAYDDPDGSFLEVPALEVAARVLATPTPADTRSEHAAPRGLAETPPGGTRKPDSLHPDQVVRNFRILRKVGAGGMGEVYEAEDLKLGRRVALKVLPVDANADAQARQRFLREARAASALNHPNVVTVHAVEEADGLDFLVMEYVEGETLKEKVERGPLELRELLDWGVQMAEAVAAAHARGIIHRDLKPGNVLLTPGGQVKVLDFGLATWAPHALGALDAAARSRLTSSGLVIGTVPYMSPEQTRGEAVDARSDVFSLGSVLYEAATGKRPFDGPNGLAILHAVAAEEPVPPGTLRPGLPKGFDAVVRRALAKDKGQRYGSAAELAEALRRLGAPGKRKLLARLAIAAGATIVLALAAGVALYWQQANRTWARENIPQVEELTRAARYAEAYDLAVRIEKYLPQDPTLGRLLPVISDVLSVTTEPPGARVYLKPFARDAAGEFPPRQLIGTTPIRQLRIARREYVLSIEKDGYAPFQRTLSSALEREAKFLFERSAIRRDVNLTVTPAGDWKMWFDADAPVEIDVKLLEAARVPERMAFVPGGEYELVGWDRPTSAKVRLDDFFIDRYEVTNREFKEFIAAGGYRRRELWQHPIVLKDGKPLPWEKAVQDLFTDRTHLPGPRSWSNQNFPEGKENHPVTDVTWYEAAAYAAFRGKQLPTLFQWEKAARDAASSVLWVPVMPWGVGGPQDDVEERANFKHRGTVPVDTMEFGMSPFGCHHMAGNVAEWCLNRRPEGFSVTGGSWQDHLTIFGSYGQYPGFESKDYLGFRCARTVGPAAGDQGGMPIIDEDPDPPLRLVSKERFEEMLSHYRYDPTPLDPQVVEVKETNDWRREKVTFVGAGGERAFAYLWLPKHTPPPFPVIDYKPGGASYAGLTVPQEVEVVCAPFLQGGRAVFVTVLKGMTERRYPPGFADPEGTSVKFRELTVNETIDERRGLDYLVTRPEIDRKRMAWFGLSKGGSVVNLTIEDRYCSVLFLAAGLSKEAAGWIPEANPVNFAPYVGHRRAGGVPKLHLHGRYDESLPFKTSAQRLFRLLPEPKELVVFDSGHFPPMEQWVPVAKAWFEKTLDPVPGP
jgi:formylglycine-generating enzyme required for sulfatase activity